MGPALCQWGLQSGCCFCVFHSWPYTLQNGVHDQAAVLECSSSASASAPGACAEAVQGMTL